ncbi:MAG: hypothetical protein JHC92_02570 [Sphingomonadaceae bacterium]|nr:hypothetical protein [Sphingomonadaceae bacterium]
MPLCYRKGDAYLYAAAFAEAATAVCGAEFAFMLQEDLNLLEDRGLLGIADRLAEVRQKYASIDHPAAREIVDWLSGGYAITGEMLRTQ